MAFEEEERAVKRFYVYLFMMTIYFTFYKYLTTLNLLNSRNFGWKTETRTRVKKRLAQLFINLLTVTGNYR